ncbi:MAG: GNAT family N-acetyltransferase [Alphaproteobacteria bacterium]|nr:GNAT family N-acetyltransferase [Alphaproteobacteria bacterium]
MRDIDRNDWNRVANPNGLPYDPFLDWDFLEALESSGCATPRTGWSPRHVLARDAEGTLTGAAPLYLKAHSRGEFIFDHGWADALERAGGRYYPKLLCAVPFTPVTGRRLLARPGPQAAEIQRTLAAAIVDTAASAKVSSVHFNFLEQDTWARLGADGLLLREDQQFHWINRDYKSFDDFLGALASRKRKMLRKERLAAQEGLKIDRLTGADLKPEHWDAFFKFYMDTGGRKWGSPYLNRPFFSLLHQRMADKVMLVLVRDGERPIAGALNMIGDDTLYGRYWGRIVDRPFLHFEVCYYQAIDFAIEHGLSRVEAGAQGEHKLARGYEPQLTRSAHWIRHAGLRDAVARYLDNEREAVEEGIDHLAAFSPFLKGDVATTDQDEEGF